MKTTRVDSYGGVPWEQTIYQTEVLTQTHGRVPEDVVARQVSAGLDDLGVDHVIHYGFDPVPASTEDPGCSSGSPVSSPPPEVDRGNVTISDTGPRGPAPVGALGEFEQYLGLDGLVATQDSNMLLTDQAGGGGCAHVGGNVCVAGAGSIHTDTGGRIMRGREDIHDSISAAMHEVTHNMGSRHSGGNFGLAWNGDVYWHRTPSAAVFNQISENACGEDIPGRDRQDFMDELWYPDCVGGAMEVVHKPPLVPGAGSSSATAEVGVQVVGMDVRLDASGSYGGGAITDYVWDMGDGSTERGVHVRHGYADFGEYTISLTVHGYDGTEDTWTETVSVDPIGGGNGDGEGSRGGIGAGEVAVAGGLFALVLLARPEDGGGD